MILVILNIIIISLWAERKSVFRTQAVLENENDPNRDTIYGEFIVFFDLECIARQDVDDIDIIQDFVDLFTCYELNPDVQDLYPSIVDHWIEMDEWEDCDEDDIIVEWDDYCIVNVEENEVVKTYGINQCLSRPVESALWNLNMACPAITDGIQFIQFASTYNPNVDIIVMDTGIDASHPQFSGITVQRIYDEYPGQALNSHGSHCAGKDYGALRVDSNTQIKLIDVRALDSNGYGTTPGLLNAYDSIINYLDQNPGKKVIINLSIGMGNSVEYNTRLATIRSKGGYSFAAAGNYDNDASQLSPASSPDTITVGAHNAQNQRSIWPETPGYESNYGNVIDIWAPGTDIKSAIVGGGSAIKDGTSMATPLVAGIAANILANNPNLDFNGIKQRLLDYAIYDIDDRRGNTNLPRVQASCAEYGYMHSITVSWTQLYGKLNHISIGSDGTIMGVNDGNLIYKYNPGSTLPWTQMSGDLIQISVRNQYEYWGVNQLHDVWRNFNGVWQNIYIDGGLKHVSVGSDGTVWGVNPSDEIFRYNGDNGSPPWILIPGALTQISVASATEIAGVNSGGGLFKYNYNGNSWTVINGNGLRFKYVDIQSNGDVYAIGFDDNGIYLYQSNLGEWSKINGAAKQVEMDDGTVVCVNDNDDIFKANAVSIAVSSMANMIQMDHFNEGSIDKDKSLKINEYLLLLLTIIILTFVNVICIMIYCAKRKSNNNHSKYTVVNLQDSESDLDDARQ